MKNYLTINLRMDLAPHPLDGEIKRLARDLRRLVRQRATDLIVAAQKNRPRSPEHTAKIIAKTKGKKRTPEQIERMTAPRRGKPLTPAHRANLSRAIRASYAARREA